MYTLVVSSSPLVRSISHCAYTLSIGISPEPITSVSDVTATSDGALMLISPLDNEADEWQLSWLTDGPGGWREFPYFAAFTATVYLWLPSKRLEKTFAYHEVAQTEDTEQAEPSISRDVEGNET